jgi:hypothetical protein
MAMRGAMTDKHHAELVQPDDAWRAEARPAPTVRADLLWLPKAGNAVEEYEDAWAITPEARHSAGRFACAVADGATETSFSGAWARLLTEAYCAGGDQPAALLAALPAVQAAWGAEVATIPLPWYAEEKARQGAFAALVGLTLSADAGGEGGAWSALASGDSCVFQVRGDALLLAFPLDSAAAFTNRPNLLASDPASNAGCTDLCAATAGTWCAGDRFYLLTDALACWFLAAFDAGDTPWQTVDRVVDLADDGEFVGWIAGLREMQALRNDDITLLRVLV